MGMDVVCHAYGILFLHITWTMDGVHLRGAYVSCQQFQRCVPWCANVGTRKVGGGCREERGEIPFIIALVNYVFLGYQSRCWYLCGFWVGWCSNLGKNW